MEQIQTDLAKSLEGIQHKIQSGQSLSSDELKALLVTLLLKEEQE